MSGKPGNPYAPPRPPRTRVSKRERRPFLWWALLAAPFLFFLIVVGLANLLAELGVTMSAQTRESLIRAISGWSSGSARAAFMVPSAWLTERALRSLRPDRPHLPQLALKLTVLALYCFGTVDALLYLGYLGTDHPAIAAFKVLNGLGTVAALPLLILWMLAAIRRRRRGGTGGPSR